MGGIIGVTGSPGAGKKTVSPLIAAELGLPCVSLNDLALSYGLLKPGVGEGGVDTRKMKKMLARNPRPALVFGHLLPYVVEPELAEKVVVLRCEPAALKRRLVSRGYAPRKVAENVEAELIGVVSADAYGAFGDARTFEVDTTLSTPADSSREAVSVVRGESSPGPRLDWLGNYGSGEKLRSLLSESG